MQFCFVYNVSGSIGLAPSRAVGGCFKCRCKKVPRCTIETKVFCHGRWSGDVVAMDSRSPVEGDLGCGPRKVLSQSVDILGRVTRCTSTERIRQSRIQMLRVAVPQKVRCRQRFSEETMRESQRTPRLAHQLYNYQNLVEFSRRFRKVVIVIKGQCQELFRRVKTGRRATKSVLMNTSR
jgi:hypothetical protein